jgi:hypothetical protein
MRCWDLKLTFQIQFFWKCIIFPFLCFLFSHLLVFFYFIWNLKILLLKKINCYFFQMYFFLLRNFSLFFLPFRFLFLPFLIYFHFVPWRMWSCFCKHIFFFFPWKREV